MPESGYYAKRPRHEHRRFLTGYLTGRPNISTVETLDDFRLVVRRLRQPDIHVYLTNQYILGVADAMEILESAPATTCIVSTMDYNHYTPEAKTFTRERGVGLFKSTEFLGAVYYVGDRFLDYLPPAERERLRQQGGS
ncbi:hypothetical protein [Streptomyces sp. NPDC042319]|uniref:hypothetical protein n=1 Tax=Streptomyces sp. NPDC042319 TaxID=3154332 RepID=UPI0033F235BC